MFIFNHSANAQGSTEHSSNESEEVDQPTDNDLNSQRSDDKGLKSRVENEVNLEGDESGQLNCVDATDQQYVRDADWPPIGESIFVLSMYCCLSFDLDD